MTDDKCSRRKQQILEEASKLFSESGYAGAKLDTLAERCGVAKGTIYLYFPTKEQLFLAVADKAMENLQGYIRARTEPRQDPLYKIAGAIEAFLDFFDENMHLIEIFVHERAEFRDRKKPTLLTWRDRNIKNLEALIVQLKEQKLVRELDEVITAAALGDLMHGTVYTYFLRGERTAPGKLADQIVDLFFNGILTPEGKEVARKRGICENS